jgi:TetR/AcrR family transcriptional repressor of nem operon
MPAGRPRQFDEEVVLGRAMELFWLRGYERLGLAELLKHMGISRQSLYDTFGNKRGLFVRAIEHYRATQLSQALALLERDGSPVQNVRDVLAFFEGLALHQSGRGCLVANALVEVHGDDELSGLLGETLDLLRSGIERALREAQKGGELSEDKSPVELSHTLVNAMLGLVVMGRLRPDPAVVRDVYAGTLGLLA